MLPLTYYFCLKEQKNNRNSLVSNNTKVLGTSQAYCNALVFVYLRPSTLFNALLVTECMHKK